MPNLKQRAREEFKEWFAQTRSPIGEGFTANTDQVANWWLAKLDQAVAEENDSWISGFGLGFLVATIAYFI